MKKDVTDCIILKVPESNTPDFGLPTVGSFAYKFERVYKFNPELSDREYLFLSDIITIGTQIKDQTTLKKLISDIILKVPTTENE